MNELSGGDDGDRSLHIDGQEIQLARYDGLRGTEQYFLRHKDAFKVDANNLTDGQKLRKLTVIVYLND